MKTQYDADILAYLARHTQPIAQNEVAQALQIDPRSMPGITTRLADAGKLIKVHTGARTAPLLLMKKER